MLFEAKLAWRYFRARRKSLARFTALVAIVGIAAGVASLILANALARGFADEMQDKILTNTAHISVSSIDGAEISDWREIKAKLETLENVREISPTVYESAVLIGNETTNYAVLRVESQKTKVENKVEKSSIDFIEISIGKELAEKSFLKIGDAAQIITIENESAPRTTKVFVKEIFQTGLYEYDSTWIRISPENYARLKSRFAFAPTLLSVSLKDIYSADKTAKSMSDILGERFKIVGWQQANQTLFAALSLEKQVALAIISLIIFIAALNITTTLALLVNERRLDIAILRTCGAQMKSLILIFLLEGSFLGLLGIFGGVLLGLLGCFLGNYFKVISLSKEVYSLNSIPFHANLASVALIIFIAFFLCLTATIYPAFKASRVKPLENLRRQ